MSCGRAVPLSSGPRPSWPGPAAAPTSSSTVVASWPIGSSPCRPTAPSASRSPARCSPSSMPPMAAAAAAVGAHEDRIAERHRLAERAAGLTSRVEALQLALDAAHARAGAERLAGVEGVLGTLLDLVRIDAGWESAVEAALGEALTRRRRQRSRRCRPGARCAAQLGHHRRRAGARSARPGRPVRAGRPATRSGRTSAPTSPASPRCSIGCSPARCASRARRRGAPGHRQHPTAVVVTTRRRPLRRCRLARRCRAPGCHRGRARRRRGPCRRGRRPRSPPATTTAPTRRTPRVDAAAACR